MAQVIDTTGKQRDASREANGLPQVVSGSSHGGNKAEVKPDLKPGVEEQQYSSSPFTKAVKRYTGISGGTPTTSRQRQSSQAWSPTYASLSSTTKFDHEPKSYWDKVQEENQRLADSIDAYYNGDDEQQTEESSELMPEMRIESASDSGYEYKPGEGTVNRWGEEYKDDPVGPINTDWIGNTRTNDRYEDLFATGFNGETDGMPAYDLETTHGRKNGILSTGSTSPTVSNVIDDGTMDYEHLTSPRISGSQLIRYAENGLAPGMTPDDIRRINPERNYVKSMLPEEYKFKPYIPDARTYADMMLSYPSEVVSKNTGELANIRGNIASVVNPYEINYTKDGNTRQFNGNVFDEGVYDYMANVYHNREYNPEMFFDDSHNDGGHWSQYAQRWDTQTPTGETEHHYGSMTSDFESNHDGTVNIVFEDGSQATVSDSWFQTLLNPETNNYEIPVDYDGSYWVMTPDGGRQNFYSAPESYSDNMDGTTNVNFSDGSTATMSDQYLISRIPNGMTQDDDGQWWVTFEDYEPDKVSDEYAKSVMENYGRNADGSYEFTYPMIPYGGLDNVTDLGLEFDTAQLNGTAIPDRYVDANGVEHDQLANPDVVSYWAPDYVMDDGTVVSYLDAMAMAGDTNGRESNDLLGDGDSIDYDFDTILPVDMLLPISYLPGVPQMLDITNMPLRLQPEPLSVNEDGEVDLSNLFSNSGNRILDWTAGSLPIMINRTQWPASLSNATQDLGGMSSADYNPYGNNYGWISAKRRDDGTLTFDDNSDDIPDWVTSPRDTVAWLEELGVSPDIAEKVGMRESNPLVPDWLAPSLFDPRLNAGFWSGNVPSTENLVGPISDATPSGGWIEKALDLDGPGALRGLGRWVHGWHGEGKEEILGNIFEELQRYGLARSFGNYIDKNGDVVATEAEAAEDENGLPMKQQWSPIPDRLYNAGIPMPRDGKIRVNNDALVNNINAYIGGAAMSAIPVGWDEMRNTVDYNRKKNRLGEMGLDDFYTEPERVFSRQAPENYLEQWR